MSVCLAALAAVPGLLPILGQTRLSLAIIKHSAPFKTVSLSTRNVYIIKCPNNTFTNRGT